MNMELEQGCWAQQRGSTAVGERGRGVVCGVYRLATMKKEEAFPSVARLWRVPNA